MRLTLSFLGAFLFNGLNTPKVLSARVSSDVFMKVGEQEDRLESEPWCCKCGAPAANGKPVYSCSKRGLCRMCNKFGGRKNATRIPAPYGGKCASVGAHYSCKKAFQASEAERQTAGEDVQQPEENVAVAEGERNTRLDSKENSAAPVDEEVMEQTEQVHQPEDSHGGAYEESTTTSDSKEKTDVSLGEETTEGKEDEVHQPEDSTGEEALGRDEKSQQPQDSVVGTDDTAASEPEEATAALEDEVKQPEAEEATVPLDEEPLELEDVAQQPDDSIGVADSEGIAAADSEHEQVQPIEDIDSFADGESNAIPESEDEMNAPVDAEGLELADEEMQQPDDGVAAANANGDEVPDSEEGTGAAVDDEGLEPVEGDVQQLDDEAVADGENDAAPDSEETTDGQIDEETPRGPAPVCCKCMLSASNGNPVYSCSTTGSCRFCKKYGGQKNALKKPAPSGGQCATRSSTGSQVDAHHSCRTAFENTDMFGVDPAVPSDEEALEEEDDTQQPEDLVGVVDDKSSSVPDSEEETGVQIDAEASDEKALAHTGPVCCKCSTPASNGKTVYSCSASGSCSICKKYGGEANAFRKPPSSGSKCAAGSQAGAHFSCKKLFESTNETEVPNSAGKTEGTQDEPMKRDAYEVWNNNVKGRENFGKDPAVPSDEGLPEKEEKVQQPGDVVNVADDKSNSSSDSEETGIQIDAELPEEKAPSSGPVCCKCSTPASNGKTVYSCSPSGKCRVCKKYGGQKSAIRRSAPSGGKCASGKKITGMHSECSQLFESEAKDVPLKIGAEKEGKQHKLKTNKSDAYEVWRNQMRPNNVFGDNVFGDDIDSSATPDSVTVAGTPSDEELSIEKAPSSTGPVCCKCSTPASNGKIVYSCSARGTCHLCSKYGGQTNAIRIPAPSGGKCASGQQTGAHYDCRKAFEDPKGNADGSARELAETRMRLLGSGRTTEELPEGKGEGKRKSKRKRKVSLAGKVPPSRTGVGVDEEDAPSLSRETSKGPVCCKCGALASNGKTVYSCSPGGRCRTCKKYGGQKAATKKPALSGGKCATGQNIGAHYECKRIFEGASSKSSRRSET